MTRHPTHDSLNLEWIDRLGFSRDQHRGAAEAIKRHLSEPDPPHNGADRPSYPANRNVRRVQQR